MVIGFFGRSIAGLDWWAKEDGGYTVVKNTRRNRDGRRVVFGRFLWFFFFLFFLALG